jgi:hypothetical protein
MLTFRGRCPWGGTAGGAGANFAEASVGAVLTMPMLSGLQAVPAGEGTGGASDPAITESGRWPTHGERLQQVCRFFRA